MANIVNGGAIILVAAFFLAAVVGGADEFRTLSGSDRPTGPNADLASSDTEPSKDLDVRTPILGKHGLDEDRGRHGDGDGKRDRDGDKRHGDDDDEKDDEDDN